MTACWNRVIGFFTGKGSEQSLSQEQWGDTIKNYNALFEEDEDSMGHDQKAVEVRTKQYSSMVNAYYDLVTDFYEYGWGQSFHFAARYPGETFESSVARHEHFLALYLGLRPGMKCLDVGCGVGGPMRTLARFSGADITGITINAYQVKRTTVLNQKFGLSHLCRAVQGNFMELPFAANSFDAAYAIEATCHAPDKVACFKQIYNALKPGAIFANLEWCMTDNYDPSNAEHRRIKHEIEAGDSLPDLVHPSVVVEATKKAGFEIVDAFDIAERAPHKGETVPWYSTLQGGMKLSQIKHSKYGRVLTQAAVDVMESLRIAPKGTSETHRMLCMAADALARGGELQIFTPMFLCVARKPLDKKKN